SQNRAVATTPAPIPFSGDHLPTGSKESTIFLPYLSVDRHGVSIERRAAARISSRGIGLGAETQGCGRADGAGLLEVFRRGHRVALWLRPESSGRCSCRIQN